MNVEKKHAEESTPGGCGFFLSREHVDGQDHIPGKGDDHENALKEPTKLHCPQPLPCVSVTHLMLEHVRCRF